MSQVLNRCIIVYGLCDVVVPQPGQVLHARIVVYGFSYTARFSELFNERQRLCAVSDGELKIQLVPLCCYMSKV
jgi:hypothetical protein